MGAFLEKPKTEKIEDHGSGHNLKWGVSAMQGWRLEMEDAHTCKTDLKKLPGWSFFAVFDGHAGSKVSNYCSTHLLDVVVRSVKEEDSEDGVCKKLRDGFLEIDETLRGMYAQSAQSAQSAQNDHRGGTTAIVCMVSPKKFIWANCGDSRGLLCRDGKLEFNTTDHKPMNEGEKIRIEKAGGTVMMQRVNGSLAVSRALGDFDYKRVEGKKQIEQLVSPEPDICVIERSEKDQFLLLACDGVFDVMSNDEIISFVLHHLELEESLLKICSKLIDTCLNKNSRDNMSVILITFPNSPSVSKEAIEKNKKVIEDLRQQITKKLDVLQESASDPLDMEENYVVQQLNVELSPQYPEIYSLRDFIKVENKSRITTKFGPDANNFSAPEISGYQQFHPPAEFTQEPDPNTPVVFEDPPEVPMDTNSSVDTTPSGITSSPVNTDKQTSQSEHVQT